MYGGEDFAVFNGPDEQLVGGLAELLVELMA